MTTFHYFNGSAGLSPGEAAFLVDLLRQGELVVLPTETGPLLGALATSVDAIGKAFAVKGRDPALTMHIACASRQMAQEYGRLPLPAWRLLAALTPGPLTVVVDQAGRLPDRYVTRDGTVGIRIPDHPATLQVIAALGVPITATSLNRSGEPAGPPDRPSLESLDWPATERVGVVEDPRPPAYATASTVVRATGPDLEILRVGPIDSQELRRVAAVGWPGEPRR